MTFKIAKKTTFVELKNNACIYWNIPEQKKTKKKGQEKEQDYHGFGKDDHFLLDIEKYSLFELAEEQGSKIAN